MFFSVWVQVFFRNSQLPSIKISRLKILSCITEKTDELDLLKENYLVKFTRTWVTYLFQLWLLFYGSFSNRQSIMTLVQCVLEIIQLLLNKYCKYYSTCSNSLIMADTSLAAVTWQSCSNSKSHSERILKDKINPLQLFIEKRQFFNFQSKQPMTE